MMKKTRLISGALAGMLALSLCACVDQHPESSADTGGAGDEPRIVATSYATVTICDKLGLDLVAVPQTSGDMPERYEGLPEVGTAMAPDTEAISLLDPTDVIGPESLKENLEESYKAAGLPYTFIDLQSVQGMYDSITMLGEKYGAEEEAQALNDEYQQTMDEFHQQIEGKESPKVLVLMGLPGAYISCTQNSYAGSLVELAGAENVVHVDTIENFVSWNTEELLALDPDIILLTAHGLPDEAMEMFAEEFAENDIWQHFRAVQEGKIYQLDYEIFGMSCTFDWPEALANLKQIFYDGGYPSYTIGESSVENNT